MPISSNSYGSQIDDHHAVRRVAGMFDVSHRTVIDLPDAREVLRRLLANSVDNNSTSVAKQRDGVPRQLAVLMMDEKGVLRHGQKVFTAQSQGRTCLAPSRPAWAKPLLLRAFLPESRGPSVWTSAAVRSLCAW